MAKYYGIERSSDYLAHYGVRGMRWGVRKALQQTGSHLRPRSKAYTAAQKKLRKATMTGGIIGGALYAHKHKDELNNSSEKMLNKPKKLKGFGLGFGIGNKAYEKALKNRAIQKSVKSKNPNRMYKEAMAAGKRVENARNNLSALGRHGFGKTAKVYRDANIAASKATKDYYNSLSKKEYAKLRRKHVG